MPGDTEKSIWHSWLCKNDSIWSIAFDKPPKNLQTEFQPPDFNAKSGF